MACIAPNRQARSKLAWRFFLFPPEWVIGVNEIELRRPGDGPQHQEMMRQVGHDQPDADHPQSMAQAERKTPRQRQEEEADVAVMDAQAERQCADRGGVARRLPVESEAKEERDRLEEDGQREAAEENLPPVEDGAQDEGF